MMKKIYPREGDTQTVYLNAVVADPSIEVGDYTMMIRLCGHRVLRLCGQTTL
ncbi:putative acetyltransferase [Prevotella sp. CAG:1124]|uniref:Uncharacterized protein n=1 Tax=Marseilla massiliensis TaxID=1841864 RepID=A0A939B8A2_9BACT|nr:hypothetical protein [Marseilla massiliensis]CCY65671.1 putative acetyltransferase [Prevotella sp. CAG:1124]